MPVPKKRVGHSNQGHRRSNWKATVPTVAVCPNCGAPRHPHTMCGVCGFYKDRVIPKSLQGLDFAPAAVGAAQAEHVHGPDCNHPHGEEGHVHGPDCDHHHDSEESAEG
ncbi:MAG: 50S ribosomal protein L32 [Vampirovibrionales bacterium]